MKKYMELLALYFSSEDLEQLEKIFTFFRADGFFEVGIQTLKGLGLYDKFLCFCKDYIAKYNGSTGCLEGEYIIQYMFATRLYYTPHNTIEFAYIINTNGRPIWNDGFAKDVLIMPIFSNKISIYTSANERDVNQKQFEIPNYMDCESQIRIYSLVEQLNILPENTILAQIRFGEYESSCAHHKRIKFLSKSLKVLTITNGRPVRGEYKVELPSMSHLSNLQRLNFFNVAKFSNITGRKFPKNLKMISLSYGFYRNPHSLLRVETTILKACPNLTVVELLGDDFKYDSIYKEKSLALFKRYGFQYNEEMQSYIRL